MAKKKSANDAPANALTKRYITPIEYVGIAMSRIGGMFSTTLTGTLATAFLHELYYGPAGVDSEGIAQKLTVQTTITTIAGILIGLLSGVLVQKWKTRLGHYRHWYFINLIPMFALTVMFFWVPSHWSVTQMTWWRYGVALCQTVFNAFNTLSQNIVQVISPDPKEKKTVATCWQLFYYIGYGGAYLATMAYGHFSDDKNAMYMRLAFVAAVVAALGNLMCGLFCKERIEIETAPKEKEAIANRSVAICIILSIVTFGIYYIYWKYLIIRNIKIVKKDESKSVGELLCCLFIPFFTHYWWYTRGKTVKDEFNKLGFSATGNEVVYLVLSIFGLGIVSMAIMQEDFNTLTADQSSKRSALSKDLFKLFKYRNYRCFQYMTFANTLAALGKWSTYLAAITVGSSKNLLLTLPTAVGTVVGNVITSALSKKYEPTKLLRFCGIYSMCSAALVFVSALIEWQFGIYFFSGKTAFIFYAFYFLFGIGIGVQELSTSHFNVEYYDYLEWQTGKRMEAVQGIIPGWINTGLNYVKEVAIPYIIVWIGYEASVEGDLVVTMQAKPDYMRTCLWLLALLVFTYALSVAIKAICLKFLYNVEGETKQKMYAELAEIRAARDAETAAENA